MSKKNHCEPDWRSEKARLEQEITRLETECAQYREMKQKLSEMEAQLREHRDAQLDVEMDEFEHFLGEAQKSWGG